MIASEIRVGLLGRHASTCYALRHAPITLNNLQRLSLCRNATAYRLLVRRLSCLQVICIIVRASLYAMVGPVALGVKTCCTLLHEAELACWSSSLRTW